MLVLLLVATLASLVASSVLGARLLRLAHRTREIPELAIGTSFIVAGVIGYVMMLMGNPGTPGLTPEQAFRCFAAGYALIGFGVACIYVFIWRTFRPDAPWALALAIAGCVLLLCTGLPEKGPEGGQAIARGPSFWIGVAARVGGGTWGAVESYRWWRLLRRRLRLGLADAVVTNRFFLWGTANVSTSVIFVATTFSSGSEDQVLSGTMILTISSLTLLTACTQWLAFFPFRGYRAWIRARADSLTAASAGG